MSTEFYMSEAPPGTSKTKIQKLIQTHQGNKMKILADIGKLNAEYQEKNSWVEVRQKPKKKVTKPVNNYKNKKQYNGHENVQKKPYSQKNYQKPQKNNYSNSMDKVEAKPAQAIPTNTWASKLFTEKQESIAKEETVSVTPPEPVELKQPTPNSEKKLTVSEVEADLKKATAKVKELAKEEVKEKISIVPKVILSTEAKNIVRSSDVPEVGKVSFGNIHPGPATVSLESLVMAQGKEVVEKGTLVKLAALELELKRAKDEVLALKKIQADMQSEKNKVSSQSLEYSRRVQELEKAAKEKDILRDEVSQLTKQLKEHKISQSQLYDRLKEDKKTKQEEKSKPPGSGPPPGHMPPQQQGFNAPPQHQVYPSGLPYYQPPPPYFTHQYQFPPQHQNRSHYSYDNQPGHGPPNHPPGSNPAPPGPGSDHSHFHDEFRGSSMRRMQSNQNTREHPLDKNVQNAAPPGYGNPNQQQYSFPPYPQQPYHGQGQQKWPGR